MFGLKKIKLIHLFQFFIIGSLLISFYMLYEAIQKKSYKTMNCWSFPMLLAIFLETIVV